MKLAIISNEFPPLMSSGAVQVKDLANEFFEQGHDVTVVTATYGLNKKFKIENNDGVRIVRFPALKTKEVSYFRRTLNEILTPYLMIFNLKRSPIVNDHWDAILWYSPTIFLAPIARYLKNKSKSPGYLILRDIFPDWAVDMGIIRKGFAYKILKIFEQRQYSVADIIGVQSKGNLSYFDKSENKKNRVEVLHNWLSHQGERKSTIDVSKTSLSGRKIFIYAGNMGVAQGIDILFELALILKEKKDIGFIFVGRGSEMDRFREKTAFQELENILFFDQIHADEIPSLYEQCSVGLLSLDIRHKTHNIPGKFLSYIASGLPVLASVNPGNDLIELINKSKTGLVIDDANSENLSTQAMILMEMLEKKDFRENCKELSKSLFQPKRAVEQIAESISEFKINN